MCEACEEDSRNVSVVIEFPAQGSTYGPGHGDVAEYGVYAYDTYPRGSVNAGRERRRARGRYETLAEAKSEHPKAEWTGGSGFVQDVLPDSAPDWFDPAAAGESWDGD